MAIIIAPIHDPHACVVAKRLETLGAEPIILDSADFPSRWHLAISISNGEPQRYLLTQDRQVLEDRRIAGVWWRRPQRHLPAPEVEETHLRRFITLEAQAAFEGWLHCLGERVINPIAADRSAAHKLLQLQCASDIGLRIPRTLATNSPEKAHEFFDANGPQTVYKPFTAAQWQLIATRRLTPDAVAQLDAVAYAPVLFQEEIDKVADVRVNIIDSQVFAVLIRTKKNDAPIDWRIDPARDYLDHELPLAIQESLLVLMKRLGLRFAACDLALTKGGEYVFFEANTGGQWLFAEIKTGQEISWAFARALLNPEGNHNEQEGASSSH